MLFDKAKPLETMVAGATLCPVNDAFTLDVMLQHPNLAGQFKLGGWRHFGAFPDQRFASNGVSLAAPSSSGAPLLLAGDIGGWAVFEQQIYRVPNTDDRGIGIFGRISEAPADRNLIDLYMDAGIEFIGLSDKRPDDKFGIAAGYAAAEDFSELSSRGSRCGSRASIRHVGARIW